jgi:cyclophilin family peptidyl-prolyl cis-trans isomerase
VPKQYASAPPLTIDPAKSYTATIETTAGTIVAELFPGDAPATVNNFVFLSRDGFYDGVIFHRVISGFMIQGGDPTGTGRGGPGYRFADEPVRRPYTRGTLAMANAGPDTNGSQFFVMHADYRLPPNYTIFGKLTSGEEVVDAIANAPTGAQDRPSQPVSITSVTIKES